MVPVPTGRNSFLSCANRNSSEIKVIFGLILLLAADQVQVVKSQTVNEPVNVNWVISLPWDVSNTLRAPFGGPVSLLLSVTAAAALLLGLLLAPVNYILGFPPRIYHTYRVPGILGKLPLIKSGRSFNSAVGGGEDSGENYSHYQHYYHHPTNITNGQFQFYDDGDGDGESFDMADILVHLFERVSSTFKIVFDKDSDYDFGEENFTGRELSVVKADEEESYGPPGFLDSIFLLVPEEDEICRQLMVCHAHGFLDFLPTSMVKLYKVLSKHFITIPDDYKAAIKLGLKDQGECQNVYRECPRGLFQLTRGSFGVIREKLVQHFLPEGTKDLWQYFYSSYVHAARSH